MSINQPIQDAEATYVVCVRRPAGAMTLFLSADELAEYNTDPDLFAAKEFNLGKSEYIEWVRLDGTALCGERTKSGRQCRNSVGGGSQLDAGEWKEKHRQIACSTHEYHVAEAS
jgi:hypothetical protein